jgi:hypothetical protein
MTYEKAAQKSYEERRAHPRVPLDAPFFVTLLVEESKKTSALLVDCGKGGLQLALSPAESALANLLSASVLILGLPRQLDGLGEGLSGSVSWISAERCGVSFTSPLSVSDDSLLAFTKNL